MAAKRSTPTPNRKFIGLKDEVHEQYMSIARKSSVSANDVMVAMLGMIDRDQLVKRLKTERAKQDAAKQRLRARQKQILDKLSRLDPEQLDKLLNEL